MIQQHADDMKTDDDTITDNLARRQQQQLGTETSIWSDGRKIERGLEVRM
jgi:hypothetical protein